MTAHIAHSAERIVVADCGKGLNPTLVFFYFLNVELHLFTATATDQQPTTVLEGDTFHIEIALENGEFHCQTDIVFGKWERDVALLFSGDNSTFMLALSWRRKYSHTPLTSI